MRRFRLQWLLAVLLLFTQEAGIVHLTLHTTENLDDRQTSSHTGENYCAKCSQYSANGASPAPTLLVFQVTRVAVERPIAAVGVSGWRGFVAYRSRAPPFLI